jgi:hypothetical protein
MHVSNRRNLTLQSDNNQYLSVPIGVRTPRRFTRNRENRPGDACGDDWNDPVRVSFFMNRFRQLGFIAYNGGIEVHSSLLNVVLHDQQLTKN